MNVKEELENALAMHRNGDINAAMPVYEKILTQIPDHPEALHLLGVAKLQKNDHETALDLLTRAVGMDPDNPKAFNNLGAAFLALSRPEEAAERFEQAIQLDPSFADARYNLGRACQERQDSEAAIKHYNTALALNPAHVNAINNLGTVFVALGHYDKAAEIYRKAVNLRPDAAEPLANLVAALELLNRLEEAEVTAARLASVAPDMPMAKMLRARIARRENRLDEAYGLLEDVTEHNTEPTVCYPAFHEFSLVLERQKQFDRAFAARMESKRFRMKMPDIKSRNLDKFPRKIAAYSEWLRNTAPLQAPVRPLRNIYAPIFFVGFPRSGTTLMERILGAHPALVTTNERSPLSAMVNRATDVIGRELDIPGGLDSLTIPEIEALRRLFVESAKSLTGHDPREKRLVDKMPLNIIELGAVNKIFPDAKVIVALRDPRDAALSCFMQNFKINDGMIHFLKLETTGQFYRQMMGLWLEYRNWLTIPWLEYRYEDLVDDFDGVVGRVLDFVNVPWDDAVHAYAQESQQQLVTTPSYAAVTEEINKSAVSRWRNYQNQLAPILPILEPFVKEFGYEPS